MKIRKGTLSVLVILTATLLISCGYAKSATESDFPPELPGKDPLQKMIELVVEANPVLQTQRNFIKEIGEVPGPAKGLDIDLGFNIGADYTSDDEGEGSIAPIGKIELTIPLYSSAKKRKIALDNLTLREKLTKAWQDYYNFKNSLISGLLERVDEIIILENELEGQEKLLSLLQYNLEALRKQVEAGVTMPSSLWNMSERLITSEINIANLLGNLNTLKRETAVNLAGDRWQELLKMLDEI
ncbi:hypothetical protein LCGC14_1738060 [marine sediment metagenome]|uniref:TolC family protein n=1 Tax=marine sediment metagenome TaxID=412755 RepID=A0A0F9K770_9ZZZZ